MTLVDVKLTQGSYWKGAQLPYWVYMVVVVLLGGLGLDHLLLRSPYTFLMKLLIPTFGFWYLYDIAQIFGERELVEKYGLGIPWYGPIGLGAGIFINSDSSNISPPTIPKPWIFMGYAILSIFFFIIPLNKILIGDYYGCIAQISMYTILALFSLGITAILAVCWGIYDAYRVIFDTKGLFEKGAARVFPATWLGLDEYFNKGALGPEPGPAGQNSGMTLLGFIPSIFAPILGLLNIGTKAVTKSAEIITKVGGKAVAVTDAVVDKVSQKTQKMSNNIERKFENIASEADIKVDAAINKAVDKTVGGIIDKATNAPINAADALISGASATTAQLDAATAATKTTAAMADTAKAAANVLEKGPEILEDVADKLGDPKVHNAAVAGIVSSLLPAAPAVYGAATSTAIQKGGAMMPSSSDPAFSSAVLIFSVALLAFGGYVMYSFRKAADLNRNDRQDDSPPDTDPVRGPSKAERA